MRGANRPEEAQDQLLQSLEAAPGFKPAQKTVAGTLDENGIINDTTIHRNY